MKQIPLTQGKVALVDDDMYEFLNQWKWYANKAKDNKWYAARSKGKRPFRNSFRMHREIMGVTDPKIEVDHRDGDGLNCQRYNLRKCTHAQNVCNRKLNKNNTSGYKGVRPRSNKHHAYIRVNGTRINLGNFTDPVEAARAYDEAARKHFGEFANLNFPQVAS